MTEVQKTPMVKLVENTTGHGAKLGAKKETGQVTQQAFKSAGSLIIPVPPSALDANGRFIEADKSEIEEMRKRVEVLSRNPRPNDKALEEETKLTAQLIGYAVLWTDKWANNVKPDHIILGEVHDVTAQNLVQPLLAMYRQADLGLECPTNELVCSFHVWAHHNKRHRLDIDHYPVYEKALFEMGLNKDSLNLCTETSYSSLSHQWISFALRQQSLAVQFNDHAEDAYGDLMGIECDERINTVSRKGMKRRNQYMVDKMGEIQQAGLAHIAGRIGSPFEDSMVAIAQGMKKNIIAPIFSKKYYQQRMPKEAEGNEAIKPHFLPGREFNKEDDENYSFDLEQDYLRATLSHFGFGGDHFDEFLTARDAAKKQVNEAFEKVYSAQHPSV